MEWLKSVGNSIQMVCYYMDEDGYGMTSDQEITIYGFIDRQGHVLVKFHAINDYKELDADRKKAERIVREKENI